MIERTPGAAALDDDAVKRAYRRWAPIYDYSFGVIAGPGRRRAVRLINESHVGRPARVLEVGVGTGLSLPGYDRTLTVTGIDLSTEMLAKARERTAREKLAHVAGLYEMDASAMTFADGSFETVVAMYVMTVVPDAAAVMRELARVCAPGGEVMLVNHFSQEHGVRGWAERKLAPFAQTLGWHPVFPPERVMVCPELKLTENRGLFPGGLFSLLRFRKA
ncbi:MAG: class I SAM-dependent methyltransferase [Hyphomicrobiales bacterium]|nr:class I SAM-dependent methyltransferase [Hyphomicrobiales bacterium]